MSERPPLRGIVVTHGTLAEGLVDAVRQIAGTEEDVLVPMSNRGLSPETVLERVRDAAGNDPVVVFTDLQSGSCAIAGRRLCRERSDLVVITGVNLPVLLDFVLHRELPLEELVPRLLDRGRAAICCTPGDLESHADRAVSGG
jgi:mannose/fructose-specific phosphotransferase system component IIA